MASHSIYGLPADVSWDGIDPADWRDLPADPQGDRDDDEDLPATADVIAVLGFDPDTLDGNESEMDPVQKALTPDPDPDDLGDPDERAHLIADILGGLAGDAALAALQMHWKEYDPKQPRDARGRFSKVPHERVDKAHELITPVMAGDRDPKKLAALGEHLQTLTVAQLKEVRDHYGLKAEGRTKFELYQAIGERMLATGPKLSGQARDVAVLDAMRSIEPQADQTAMVVVSELRDKLKEELPGQAFDEAVMDLARRDVLTLQKHNYSLELTVAEKGQLLHDDQGNYFMGVAMRPKPILEKSPTKSPAAVDHSLPDGNNAPGDVTKPQTQEKPMNQVEYNQRHAAYASERKAIERKYAAMEDEIMDDDSLDDDEKGTRSDALAPQLEAELAAAHAKFAADTVNFGMKGGN